MTRVALLGPASDPTCNVLAAAFEREAPGHAVRVALDVAALDALSLDAETVTLGGVSLLQCRYCVVSGFDYMDPVVPSPATAVDWSRWRHDYVTDLQHFSTSYSVLAELQRRGIELLNPPTAHVAAFSRAAALGQLACRGINVPDWRLSNLDAAVDVFRAAHDAVVWRPVTGRAAWQRFTPRQQKHLVAPSRPPVLLAEAIEGPLLQAWLLHGEPLLTLARQEPSTAGLESFERYWTVDPAEAGADRLGAINDALDAPWLAVSYVLGTRGPVIYDVDPAPLFDDLPRAHATLLVQRLVHRLLGRTDRLPASDATIHERPLPFLRRMLRDLFAYEASKYDDAG